MMSHRHPWIGIVWLLAVPSCEQGETTVRDTEGRVYALSCEQGDCALQQKRGPEAKAGKTASVLDASGHFVAACDVVPGGNSRTAADCRPLVCEGASDCPALGAADVGCGEGLCTTGKPELSRRDVVMKCLAGTGIGLQSPRAAERYALALNCGSPCELPAACR